MKLAALLAGSNRGWIGQSTSFADPAPYPLR